MHPILPFFPPPEQSEPQDSCKPSMSTGNVPFFMQISHRRFDNNTDRRRHTSLGTPHMTPKLPALVGATALVLILSIGGYFLSTQNASRPSRQEGFRQMMDRKAHGRELIDGFTSDPAPKRRGR